MIELSNKEEKYIWPGIDYSNVRIMDFENVSEYKADLVKRDTDPRMPWHDVHCKLGGQVVFDLCRHFVERWNFSIHSVGFKNTKKQTITKCII
jgi:phospholipase D1/2